MCENCLTVKKNSLLLGVLYMAGKSLGKLYPTDLKIDNWRLLLFIDTNKLWKANIKK